MPFSLTPLAFRQWNEHKMTVPLRGLDARVDFTHCSYDSSWWEHGQGLPVADDIARAGNL